ncbi:MAG: hypothetical protein AAB921_00805, partial [Patescibacteria group bacterium]
DEERAFLRAVGFVHVTGLRYAAGSFAAGTLVQTPRPVELGRWDSNNGVEVIVTPGGEVWLAMYTCDHRLDREQVRLTINSFAPNGQGAHVPCSNGESLNMHEVLKRHANPDWEPNY